MREIVTILPQRNKVYNSQTLNSQQMMWSKFAVRLVAAKKVLALQRCNKAEQ
jgi:hypothetical protein